MPWRSAWRRGCWRLPVLTPRVHLALRGWGVVWLPALVWAGIEYLRLVTTAGHQWGMTATAQIDTAPLRAFLPLAGMWPVTIIVMATNGAIAGARPGRAWPMDRFAAGAGLERGRGGGGLGLWRSPPCAGPITRTNRHPCARLWCSRASTCPTIRSPRPLIVRRQYAELTEVITALHATPTAAAQGRATCGLAGGVRLGPIPWTPTGQVLTDQVADVAAQSGATIVWPYFIRIDRDRTRNEAVLVYPDRRISPPTTKAHPVWVIGERSITAGQHPVYAVDGVSVGLALGPDGSYTDALARLARDGAQVVAVSTHDWRAYAGTQLAHLRVRAAEHRLAIVKADWRYGSAIVAPDGGVVAATLVDVPQEATLVAEVYVTTPGHALIASAATGWELSASASREPAALGTVVTGRGRRGRSR